MLRGCGVFAAAVLFAAGLAQAQAKPSSDLLLPYFEVDLEGEATTVFAVTNVLDRQVDVVATVHTNWAIPVLDVPLRLKPREIRTLDLRPWLLEGSEEETAHLRAALSGRPSPRDGLYYSSPAASGRAAGYVTLRTGAAALRGASRHEDLVDIASPAGLCNRYVLRVPKGGAEALLWQDAVGQPSLTPDPAEHRLQVAASAVSERGERAEERPRMVLPLERISLEETGPDGWIEIAPEGRSYLSFRDENGRTLPVLKAACAEARKPRPPKIPKISIVKLTNGRDASGTPGPKIPVGSPVLWQYQVTNSGGVTLDDVEVFDDQGVTVTCPKRTLKAGQAMSCTGRGVAAACQYSNTGFVTGTPAKGPIVNAEDASFYFGDDGAAVRIQVSTNGQEADDPRGPTLPVGARVDWTYQVTNTGKVRLTGISVQDDRGAEVTCPTVALGPGQSMECTASGIAGSGQYRNVGTVTAKATCSTVSAQDASHYYGEGSTGIQIRALTNGFDANEPPGPSLQPGAPVTWEYTVSNTGKLFLSQLQVTDDRGVAVSCPKNTLSIGETITCIARGVAGACQYSNLGTATAWTSGGQQVSASDRSHYTGGVEAGIRIESSVNGQDADSPPGPTVTTGLPVSWTYMVTNTGKVVLTGIAVTDGANTVSCPQAELRAGESMVCTGSGTAADGQYAGLAKATGQASCGSPVSDDDPSHYLGRSGGADDTATVQEDSPATTLNVLGNDGGISPGTFKISSVSQPGHGTVAIAQNGAALTYRPAANYCNDGSGPDLFTYTATPGNATLTVAVTVTCVDDMPQAADDVATVAEGAKATAVKVLANDADVDGGPRTIASVDQPAHGTVGITGNGTGLSYLPDANYCNNPPGLEPDSFTYTLEPGGAAATVSVLVNCVDNPPSAVDDQYTRQEDSGATQLDVLANDADTDGGARTIASVTQPDNGFVTVVSGGAALTYQPQANYCNDQEGAAPDLFTYTLTQGGTAAVSVKVTCVDDPPVAVADAATVNEDAGGAISVLANDTDVDGGPKTLDSLTQPANGTVAVVGGGTVVTYTPKAGYCNNPPGTAPDTFTYTLVPGGSTATVTVLVNCEVDSPVPANDTPTVGEDSGASPVDVLANDVFPEAGARTIASVTQPANGTVAIVPGGASLTYSPNTNYCNDPPGTSPDLFTYAVTGGGTATVAVKVTCVDDPPAAVADTPVVSEDSGSTSVNVLANDTDVDGGAKTISAVTQPAKGAVTIASGGATLSYSPLPGYCNNPPGSSPDTFTYTLAPGGSTATVAVLVNCVDDPPTAANDTASVTEDDPATLFDVLVNDSFPDGNKVILSATQPPGGTVALTQDGTALTYKPRADYCNNPPGTSPDHFAYSLSGGSQATVLVVVQCVDDPPVPVDDNPTVNEDAAATTFNVLANDTDIDAGPKSIVAVSQPANGTVAIVDGGAGLAYQPKAGYCNNPGGAPDTFLYTVAPGNATATVRVLVNCSDDPPTPVDDSVTVNEDSADTSIDVLANDSDPDGGPKAIAAVVPPGNGTVTLAADGKSLSYRPDPNYCNKPPGTALDTFVYTVTPGNKTATVTVFVNCADDPPTAVNDVFTVLEDSGISTLDVRANDTDPDGGTKTIASATKPPHGTVSVSAGTSLTYRPDNNYCNLPGGQPDTFTYTLNPGGTTATVSVQVTCVNDPPTADPESYETIGNTEVRVDLPAVSTPFVIVSTNNGIGVLEGDGDVDGNPLLVSRIVGCPATSPLECESAQAKIEMLPTGQFSFTPKGVQNSPATYTFQYEVTDGTASATGTVTITPRQRVWYVRHDAPATGTGVSNDPFNSLAPVAGVHKDNDYVFVHYGSDGTSVGNLALRTGERVLGEHAGLTVANGVAGVPTLLVAAAPGKLPQVGTLSGTNVLPVEIAGLSPDAINLQTSGTGKLSIRDNVVRTSGASVTVNSGALELEVRSNGLKTTNAAGSALALNGGTNGTLTLKAFSGNSVDPATTGSGVTITRATFDATPGGAVQPVAAGDLTIGTVADRVGGHGLVLTNTGGSLSFGNLQIATANGAGLRVDDAALATGMTLAVSPDVSQIDAMGGPALEINKAAVDLRLGKASSNGSATSGISLTNVTGTFSAESASRIELPSSATGSAFLVSGSNAAVTYKGEIRGRRGISLSSNNAATTISFTGEIDLDTATEAAFTATNAGTLTVTGIGNRLMTKTGIPLNVTGTTIGAQGLTFQRIASDSAASGIVVNATGASGGLLVEEAWIFRATGDAVSLANLQNVSLTRMDINEPAGHAITASNLGGTVTITESSLRNVSNDGIRIMNTATTISHLTISDNDILSNTTRVGSGEAGINISSTGTAQIVKATIDDNTILYDPGIGIKIQGGSTTSTAALSLGTAGNPVSITRNKIGPQFGLATMVAGIDVGFVGCMGQARLVISGNDIFRAADAGIRVPLTGRVQTDVTIETNDISVAGIGIQVLTDGRCTLGGATGRLSGPIRIRNNTVLDNVQSGLFVDSVASANADLDLTVTGNKVEAPTTSNQHGILLETGTNSGTGNQFCAVISGNTSAGNGTGKGIALIRAGTLLFNIVGLTGSVISYVDGQNPLGGGTALISQTTGFNACTQ